MLKLQCIGSLFNLSIHLVDGRLENNLGDVSLDLECRSDKVIVNRERLGREVDGLNLLEGGQAIVFHLCVHFLDDGFL